MYLLHNIQVVRRCYAKTFFVCCRQPIVINISVKEEVVLILIVLQEILLTTHQPMQVAFARQYPELRKLRE